MTRRLSVPLFVAMFSSIPAAAQSPEVLSIGVRLGWESGTHDFLFGLEASYVFFRNWRYPIINGPVLGVDAIGGDAWRIQLGYEGIHAGSTLGLESGPTLIIARDGATKFGWHATAFGGLIAYPFFQYSWLPVKNTKEGGFMLKYPMLLKGDFH